MPIKGLKILPKIINGNIFKEKNKIAFYWQSKKCLINSRTPMKLHIDGEAIKEKVHKVKIGLLENKLRVIIPY